MTTTSVSRANCANKMSTYGKKYTSSKIRSLSSQRVKRLTRLSGRVPSGILVATLGSWVLLLPTIPLMSAASVVKCLAALPVGWPGYHCGKASRMARYLRRLSLIVCSFWLGRAFQREYKQNPQSSRQNSRPSQRIEWSFLSRGSKSFRLKFVRCCLYDETTSNYILQDYLVPVSGS